MLTIITRIGHSIVETNMYLHPWFLQKLDTVCRNQIKHGSKGFSTVKDARDTLEECVTPPCMSLVRNITIRSRLNLGLGLHTAKTHILVIRCHPGVFRVHQSIQ